MSLDILFENIRKEEVVLWIGSGFSMYAGMPSGNDLKSMIIRELLKYDTANSSEFYNGQSLKYVA